MSSDAQSAPTGTLSGAHRAVLYFCFLFSGAAGLIYEIVWEKYLSLFIGSSGVAQIVVLATYMTGLALGGFIGGRLADRAARPLKLYMIIEAVLALYAFAFEPLFLLSRRLFLTMAAGEVPGTSVFFAAKLFAATLTILLPAVLLGATFPILTRHMARSIKGVGPLISRLYFTNSFGAVTGCLIAGFWLIPSVGLGLSILAAGLVNLVIAIAAGLLLLREGEVASKPEAQAEVPPLKPVVLLILVCTGLSGAVSMMYEVAWIRLLTLVLGSSTYAFTLMLATFILGLSLGGLLLSFWKRSGGYTAIYGLSEIGVGITVLLTLPLYTRLPYIFNQLAASLARDAHAFHLYHICQLLLCMLVMLIPTILQGITLPAATRILTTEMKGLGSRVGHVFAINTAGTCVGVVFAGVIGLRYLGLKGTLELAVGINIVLGLLILFTLSDTAFRKRLVLVSLAAVVAVSGMYGFRVRNWDHTSLSLTAGIYRTRDRIPSYEAMVAASAMRETVYRADGPGATVAVQDHVEGQPNRMLVINGKVDASTSSDLLTQRMLGHLPMLTAPSRDRVLVVGVGSGATINSVLTHGAAQIDAVEVSKEVLTASRYFDQINGRYWEQDSVREYCEDAKTFLQTTDALYDVIISEPSNPGLPASPAYSRASIF